MGAAFPSRDGKVFAVILPGQIEIRDAARLAVTARIPMATSPRLALAFAEAGQSLLVAGDDSSLRRWDLATRKLAATLPLADLPPGSVEGLYFAFSADGSKLAVAAPSALRCYDAADGKLLWRVDDADMGGFAALSPGGARLAATAANGRAVQIFDTQNGARLVRHESVGGTISALEFSRDGSLLAAAGGDQVRLLSASAADRPRTLTYLPLFYDRGSLIFSLDGLQLAIVGQAPGTPTARIGGFSVAGAMLWEIANGLDAQGAVWGLPAVFASDGLALNVIGPNSVQSWSLNVALAGSTASSSRGATVIGADPSVRSPLTLTLPAKIQMVRASNGSLAVVTDPAGTESVPTTVGLNLRIVYTRQLSIYPEGEPSKSFSMGVLSGALGGNISGTLSITALTRPTYIALARGDELQAGKNYVVEFTFTIMETDSTSMSSRGPTSGYVKELARRTLRQTFQPDKVPTDPAVPGRRGGGFPGGGGGEPPLPIAPVLPPPTR